MGFVRSLFWTRLGGGAGACVPVGVGVRVSLDSVGVVGGIGVEVSVGVGVGVGVGVAVRVSLGVSVGVVDVPVTLGGATIGGVEVLCFEIVIVHLLSRGDAQMLDGELLSGVHELKLHGPKASLEPTALGRGQSRVGYLKVGDGLEGVPHTVEPRLEPSRQGAHR